MKKFNITGTCIPEKHYMVNTSKKIEKIMKFIQNEEYFIINRPRQYGKTTTLYLIEKSLEESREYLVISISFEGVGDLIFQEEQRFVKEFLQILSDCLFLNDEDLAAFLEKEKENVETFNSLSRVITRFIKKSNKKVILMIDEVDKSSNNQLFLSFLGMLRNKYLLRASGKDITFHSVILAGVHDVKSLKLRLRADEERKYNSPWNIAVNFNVDMSFNSDEIETMLKEYSEEININMDIKALSERLHFYTNGYPFLVSKLCQIIDEEILKENKRCWNLEDIDKAVKMLLKESNTLFDDLIKNLENNHELYKLVKEIVLNGNIITFNIANPLINIGIIYGIFKEEDYRVKINNRIYEQFIYDYLSSKLEVKFNKLSNYNYRDNFITLDKKLDFQKILLKFQQFMKEQYSSIDSKFIEREGRLLFLAFIKPIVNGVGFDFKEVQISEEKRLDIVVTYNQDKYVIELKIWHGEEYHKKGIKQLADYLDIQGLEKGYLVVYNFNRGKEYKQECINHEGKEIFLVFV